VGTCAVCLYPLHGATRNGKTKVAQELIVHGADVNVGDEYGYTPLHRAACGGHTETMRELNRLGAMIDAVVLYENATPLCSTRGAHRNSTRTGSTWCYD
jgi:ankyrin repeat protein